MNNQVTRILRVIAACAVLTTLGATASARQWNATPEAQAQEYSMIQDNRPGNELVMVFWLSPQMVADKAMADVLSKSVVIGALDAHVSNDAKFTFTPVDSVLVKDAAGNELRLLKGDDIPAAAASGVQTMGTAFRQALGPVGAGFQWFVFDAGSVRSCEPGSGLRVQVAGTTYTYDTPIPGCPKT
jgi:hypothetical protein